MTTFAVLVRFEIEPGAMPRFMPLMLENAAASLAHEPGCHRFDVLRGIGTGDLVILYELYEDQAAFAAHLASHHYQTFDSAVSEMVARKKVDLLEFLVL